MVISKFHWKNLKNMDQIQRMSSKNLSKLFTMALYLDYKLINKEILIYQAVTVWSCE